MEVLYRGQMSWDVIIFKVFSHLGELALPPEAEEWFRFVDIQQPLPVDTEGWTAVLENNTITGHGALGKCCSSCWLKKKSNIIIIIES